MYGSRFSSFLADAVVLCDGVGATLYTPTSRSVGTFIYESPILSGVG